MTPAVGNRMGLAAALLDAGSPQETLEHYRLVAQGPFENDPELLAGLGAYPGGKQGFRGGYA